MNRYLYFEYKPGWFRPSKVYKLLYTLEAIAFLEFKFGVSVYQISAIKADRSALAWLLYAGLMSQHAGITYKDCYAMVYRDQKDLYGIIAKALTKSLPKKELVKETTKEPEKLETYLKDHWEHWLQSVAYIGLCPIEAEKLTPHEIYEAVKIENERVKTTKRLAAWHLAHILNMVSKKTITVEKLLGEEDPTQPFDEDEFDELWEARKRYQTEKRVEE